MKRREFISRSAGALAAALLADAQAATETKTVWGIAELWQWIYQRQLSSGNDSADCLQAHLDHGIRHVMWALGRSTLDYHSALPTSTMYAGDTRPQTKVIGDSLRQQCSLRAALAFSGQNEMVIYGRLGMNRHYGDALGGGLCSKYLAAHPEWFERQRGGQTDTTKVSYAIPEYRAERISILLEAAQIGVHGLCLDFCRQPPIARYHPRILDPWLKEGRDDPRKMSVSAPGFHAWAQHRSESVNIFMRDLRFQLSEVQQASKRRVPIMVRIPEATLSINLMEGLDLVTWLKEGLVDAIALDPIWIWDFEYPDTALTYVNLARAYGVKVYGGANTVAGRGVKANARAFLERVSRNYAEGVDGIGLFQTDASMLVPELKSMVGQLFPLLSDPAAVSEKLGAARKAQPQMSEAERFFGVDNHSLLPQLSGTSRLNLDTL